MAMEASLYDPILCALVRELLRIAELPRDAPTDLWGGPGTGSCCDVCARPIASADTEYELLYRKQRDMSLRVHLQCYEIWEHERRSFA